MPVEKKILILSLGTGNFKIKLDSIELLEGGMKDGVSPYYTTDYCFDDEAIDIERSEFLAIPLIKKFRPDEVVILGTVMSAWAELIYKLTIEVFGKSLYQGLREDFKSLIDNKPETGKDTEDAYRFEYESSINDLFEKITSNAEHIGVKKIQGICTKYGISKEELNTNYIEMRERFETIFSDKDAVYSVGFDITHSFRSLPIYNLVLLNYFRNIKDIEINISNIYYGCNEARNECGYAPVVDLKDLIYSLDLTTGVKEFLDTGNTISLIDAINNNEENEDIKTELSEELKNINDSFQFNRPNFLVESLDKIKAATTPGNKGKAGEVKEIIRNSLAEKLKCLFDNSKSSDILFAPNVQTEIAEWFFSKEVYGIAAVCAGEALRGYTTVIYDRYVRNVGEDEIKNDIYDEEIRRNSITDFFKKSSYLWWKEVGDIKGLPDGDNSICKPFISEYDSYFRMPAELNETDKKIILLAKTYNDDFQNMRNDFAHALWKGADLPFKEMAEKISRFINCLKEMAQLVSDEITRESDYFRKLYDNYDEAIMKTPSVTSNTSYYYVLVSKQNYSLGKQKQYILTNKADIQPHYDKNDIPQAQWNDKTKISEAKAKSLVKRLEKINDYEKDRIVVCFNIESMEPFDLMYYCDVLRKAGYSKLNYYCDGSNSLNSMPNMDKSK